MKVLSIDYGGRRIGVAVGDTELGIAVPKCVIKNDKRVLERIKSLIEESKVGKVVVGLPLTPSGKEGQRAREVREFVEKLRERLPDLEVVLWDERYTTQEALRRVGKHREDLDAVAAQIILEEYLQSL